MQSAGWSTASAHQQQSQSQFAQITGMNSSSLVEVNTSSARVVKADFTLDLPPPSSSSTSSERNGDPASTSAITSNDGLSAGASDEYKEGGVSDGPFSSINESPPTYSHYSDDAPFRVGFIPNIPPPLHRTNAAQSSQGGFGVRSY